MKKILFFLSAVLFLSSCLSFGPIKTGLGGTPGKSTASSLKDQSAKKYWFTGPTDSGLVILGVSNRMARHEDEIAAAKEDAAKKVAMFYGIYGRIESTHSVGAFFFDYVNDSQIDIRCDNDYSMFIEQLTYDPQRDLISIDGAVLIRFQYAATARTLDYRTVMAGNGRPNWVYYRDLPQFGDYITAVGFAQNQRLFKNTVYRSTEAAAAKMLEEMYMNVTTSESVVSVQSSTSSANSFFAVSEGHLSNFHVLEYWLDPSTGHCYSLAIARKN